MQTKEVPELGDVLTAIVPGLTMREDLSPLIPQNWKTREVPSLKLFLEQMDVKAVQRKRQAEEDSKKYPAVVDGLQEKEKCFGFSNFDPYTDSLKYNLARCKEFVKSNDKQKLILSGSVGNGKTHLAVAVMRNYPKLFAYRAETGELDAGKFWINYYRAAKGRLITAQTFFDELEEARVKGSKNDYLSKLTNGYEIVTLDDLKLNRLAQSEARLDNLYLLVNEMYRKGKRLIVTMNFEFKQLWNLDNSIADRLREKSEILVFNEQSYRGKVK